MGNFTIKKLSSNRGRKIVVCYTNIAGDHVELLTDFDSYEFDTSAYEHALTILEAAIDDAVSDLCVCDSFWEGGCE